MIETQELQTDFDRLEQLRDVVKNLVVRETEKITHFTTGEYLLPNLWVNRNTGTRAYYEFSWHDGHNYRMLATKFEDNRQKMDEEDFYDVYTMAMCTALLDPTLPFNLTMCQLEDKYVE